MSDYVVVDASIAVKWLVEEDDSDIARALKEEWGSAGFQLAAPRFLLNEVANALFGKVANGKLTGDEAVALMRRFAQIKIEYFDFPDLHVRAIQLTIALAHRATYDPTYLALAEHLRCQMWLADKEFFRPARAAGHPVRLLAEADPAP